MFHYTTLIEDFRGEAEAGPIRGKADAGRSLVRPGVAAQAGAREPALQRRGLVAIIL